MARLEDIQKEKQLLEEISNFRRKDGEINLRYRERYNNLVQQELSLQKELNKEFNLGVKSEKILESLTKNRVKLEKELDASFSSRLQNILKGNFAEVLGSEALKKSKEQQNNLATEAEELAKSSLITELKTNEQKVGVRDLTREIADGNILDSDAIDAKLDSLGIEDGLKAKLGKKAQALFSTSNATKEVTKQAAATTASYAKKIGFAGAAFAVLYQIAQQFAGQLDAIGKTFGSINVLGDDFQDTLMDSTVTATRLGGSVEDVAGISANLASNFGIGLDAAAGLSSKILDTSKAIGLSTDEAANLFGVLMQTSNLSAEQSERLAEGTFQLARANQVNPAQVLRDIAGSSETIALFTKGGADNIAQAAVQARKFGISLDTSAKIAEGLLDFENSIAKEVEASVLIGRQLNFQKAREAALDGDKVGVLKEVVKQLGSEEEFLKLNLIQRKAIADSVNMSVADMSKLVGETAKAGVQAKGFRDLFGAEGLSDFTLLMNELKATTVGLVNALGPGLMAISKVLNLLIKLVQPIIDLINFGFRGVSSVLDFVTDALPSAARPVNDVKIDKGGASVIAGPAGVFSLNPKDSVLATTNPIPVNDMGMNTTTAAGGAPNVSVVVKNEGITNRAVQQLVEVEYQKPPGTGLVTKG